MPALTDSYTITQPVTTSLTQEEKCHYNQVFEPDYSSTTLDRYHSIGINNRIKELLAKFSLLSDNWDGEHSAPPSQTAILKATYLTALLEKGGQRIFHTTPGPKGEIMVDIRNSSKSRSLELIFYSSKSISVMFPEEGVPTQEAFSFNQLPKLLEWLNRK